MEEEEAAFLKRKRQRFGRGRGRRLGEEEAAFLKRKRQHFGRGRGRGSVFEEEEAAFLKRKRQREREREMAGRKYKTFISFHLAIKEIHLQ